VNRAYYEQELEFLRSNAPEFAKDNPRIAHMLANPGSDPDVERFIEGVAFLCGQVRAKLDDELPELTHGMMALLWPHYLRPIPSLSIMEFIPDLEAMQGPLPIPKGSEFAGKVIEGTRCRYRNCWDTVVRPLSLSEVKLETAAARPLELKLLFRCPSKAKLEALGLDRLRLHLTTPRNLRSAFTLYHLLTATTSVVTVSNGSTQHGRPEMQLHPDCVVPGGMDRAEAVLPFPDRSFAGYRLLQEYFALKDRFLFVDILGLDRAIDKLKLTDTLEVSLMFDRRPDVLPTVSRDDIRLHCVPIINLFELSAEPIRLMHDRTKYLIQPARTGGLADRRHAEVYSVDEVSGLVRAEGLESRPYRPFFDFKHSAMGGPADATFFQTSIVPNVKKGDLRFGTDTYISFVVGGQADIVPSDETVSIELTCTNRNLPTQLRAGDICEPTDHSPAGVKFRNIINPTANVAPPISKSLHWKLLSHMALNHVSLCDTNHFQRLIQVYDFHAEHDAQRAQDTRRLIEGIRSIKSYFEERLIRGAPVRGVRVDVELDEECFAGEGDAYLFATILERFFALYVTVNGFSQTNLKLVRSGWVKHFPPRWGEQITPGITRSDHAHAR